MRHGADSAAGGELARVIVGGTGTRAVAVAFDLVREQLTGSGTALAPRDPEGPDVGGAAPLAPPGTGVVLTTSGSTGRPRLVALGSEGLRRHAVAVHDRLSRPGSWLLALPIQHVAGWQVLVRAALAGPSPPTVVDISGGFHAAALADAVARMPDDGPRYASLVPTQLVRALGEPAGARALARLDVVLVGGAAVPAGLLRRARETGARVVATYGATETGGGCVYDGVPLDGVEVAAPEGRIEITGAVLAIGYLGPGGQVGDGGPEQGFVTRAGRRWFRTSDLGHMDETGRLTVLGRVDDVIVSGGVNVHPVAVERVLGRMPGIGEVVVVGVPDTEWGASVTAVVVPAGGQPVPDLSVLRDAVAAELGRAWAPRAVASLPRLPLLPSGKVDRASAARMAADILARPGTAAG